MGTEGVFLGKHEENVGRELGDRSQERVNWRWPERAPQSGAGWCTHKGNSKHSAPYPPWAPLLAHPELGPPSQVHLPWKERRRRGVLGAGAGGWGLHVDVCRAIQGAQGSWVATTLHAASQHISPSPHPHGSQHTMLLLLNFAEHRVPTPC